MKKNKNILREKFENGKIITRKQIMDWFNVNDRNARLYIAELAKDIPIISFSDRKGYKMAKSEQDIEDAVHGIRYRRKIATEVMAPCNKLYDFLLLHQFDITKV